jgi:hypothetical protein
MRRRRHKCTDTPRGRNCLNAELKHDFNLFTHGVGKQALCLWPDVSLRANSGKGGFRGVLGKECIGISPFHAGLGALHGS